MNSQRSQSDQNEVSAFVKAELEEEAKKKQSNYVPGQKSGKWSDEEHMKYIVFIDFFKEKIRSPKNRRSNKFYEEMGHFISSRNSLQCRSHHQKLEEKYTHINKIIALFKPFFNKITYKNFMEQLEAFHNDRKEKTIENLTRYSINERNTVDAEVQTDIKDISANFKMINPNMVLIQKRENIVPSQRVNYSPPPIYYSPQPCFQMEIPFQATSSPLYPISHLGWYGGYIPHGM